jgi:predicted MPP superfamily phosphohydrolase
LSWHFFPHPWASALIGLGFFWLGFVFYAACLILVSALAQGLLRLFWKPTLAFRQWLAAGGALATLGLCIYGAWTVARGPQVVEREVVLEKLSPAFDGFRIAVVSDLHLGMPTLGRAFSEKVVARVNALDADIIALLGDFVDRDINTLADAIAPFKNLRAKHGVLFVTGNHEYFSNPTAWVAHFKSLGFQVLGNERVEIERLALAHPQADTAAPARLAFAGVYDLMAQNHPAAGHRTDLPAALEGWEKATPLVLLAHQPRLWKEAREAGVDLVLSGHTHGGQMWPFHYAAGLANGYIKGLYREGASQLYITTGAGQWGPPLRVGAPPEIALLRLRPPPPPR